MSFAASVRCHPQGETAEELASALGEYREALAKPVLNDEDFRPPFHP